MIITDIDILNTERFLRRVKETRQSGIPLDSSTHEFFWENPHLLMPLAFDDYYGIDWEMADDFEKANPSTISPASPPRDVADEFGTHNASAKAGIESPEQRKGFSVAISNRTKAASRMHLMIITSPR